MLNVDEVHPKPERAAEMPYAPAIEVSGAGKILRQHAGLRQQPHARRARASSST